MAEEEISRTKGRDRAGEEQPAGEQEPGAQLTRRKSRGVGKRRSSLDMPVPELRSLNPVPINLKMNNQQ
jgi:hypothetical protein